MADAGAHIAKAEHNVEFIRRGISTVKGVPFLDWIVTVHFYAAVHYIEATLARVDGHPQNHVERRELMQEHHKLFSKECLCEYKSLQALSHKARYMTDEIDDEEAKLAQDCLENICFALGYHMR